jgi:hypothetical protein
MRESPCRHCKPPKRTATCHSTCPDYKEWRAELDEENEKIKKIKDEQRMLDDFMFRNLERATLNKKRIEGKCRRRN